MTEAGRQTYICPMHSNVRQPHPGNCPTCGMALLPEGTRFALLRHMLANPLHITIMAGAMVLMAAAMAMLH